MWLSAVKKTEAVSLRLASFQNAIVEKSLNGSSCEHVGNECEPEGMIVE